jgi:hypothetical protein
VSEHLHRVCRGVRGGCWAPPGGAGWQSPPHGGSGAVPPKIFFFFRIGTALYLGGFSAHGFFADGFLFPVKELGFWTNPGHWVRVLDVAGSYMYFVL